MFLERQAVRNGSKWGSAPQGSTKESGDEYDEEDGYEEAGSDEDKEEEEVSEGEEEEEGDRNGRSRKWFSKLKNKLKPSGSEHWYRRNRPALPHRTESGAAAGANSRKNNTYNPEDKKLGENGFPIDEKGRIEQITRHDHRGEDDKRPQRHGRRGEDTPPEKQEYYAPRRSSFYTQPPPAYSPKPEESDPEKQQESSSEDSPRRPENNPAKPEESIQKTHQDDEQQRPELPPRPKPAHKAPNPDLTKPKLPIPPPRRKSQSPRDVLPPSRVKQFDQSSNNREAVGDQIPSPRSYDESRAGSKSGSDTDSGVNFEDQGRNLGNESRKGRKPKPPIPPPRRKSQSFRDPLPPSRSTDSGQSSSDHDASGDQSPSPQSFHTSRAAAESDSDTDGGIKLEDRGRDWYVDSRGRRPTPAPKRNPSERLERRPNANRKDPVDELYRDDRLDDRVQIVQGVFFGLGLFRDVS